MAIQSTDRVHRPSTSPETTDARFAADIRIQRKCVAGAIAGSCLVLALLVANIYAAVANAPAIPSGINSVLVGMAMILVMSWVAERLSRDCRAHILQSGDRGYGQGVLDGLALRASAGDGLG